MVCENCGSHDVEKTGNRKIGRVYHCRECGYTRDYSELFYKE